MEDDIVCGHCGCVFLGNEQQARIRGWRIGRGVTIGGYPYSDVLCPVSVGQRPEQVRRNVPMEGDQPLPLEGL
jgi:hypothetical protein